MQSLEPEVRRAINSIHDELMANGTDSSEPQPTRPGAQGKGRSIQTDEGLAERESQRTEKGEKQETPSRCKVIPFAGKMRAKDFGAFR
jgi:hypothetical protein